MAQTISQAPKRGFLSNITHSIGNTLGNLFGPRQEGILPGGLSYNPNTQTLSPIINQGSSAAAPAPASFEASSATAAPAGGGGYAAVNPNAQYISQAQNLINQLNSIYNSIYGSIDQTAASQRANLEQGYGNQFNQLNDQYTQTARQLPTMFAARGVADSSYATDAQDLANKTYQQNIDALNQDKQQKLGQLGQTINQAKAGYLAQQNLLNNTYAPNLGQYANQYLVGQLQQNLADATQAAAGYGPQGQFVNQLNAIAPTQNGGVDALKTQLSTIANTSLPQFAKDQLASGYVKSNTASPQDSNYWLNYYQGLNKGGGATV